MILNNILEGIGKTPIIKINGVEPENRAEIVAKAEFLGVGGSIKTRTAFNMISQAIKKGLITKDTLIVEPSSGNQGVGLALVGAVLGLKVVIIMPSSVSAERKKLINLYGGKVITIQDRGDIGECIDRCIAKAQEIKVNNENVYIPNQFDNVENVNAHYLYTAEEIIEQTQGKIDGLCLGIGSGGTLSGVGSRLKEINPNLQIWAVEPMNSAVLSGKKAGTHIQMGIGDGIIPAILNRKIIDGIFQIEDKTAIYYAKILAKKEGIACGISSGSNFAGSLLLAKKLGKGKRVLTVFPDTAERYFSTALFN